jgi:hypothetical protein
VEIVKESYKNHARVESLFQTWACKLPRNTPVSVKKRQRRRGGVCVRVIDTPRLQLSQGEGWSKSAHSIGAARPNSAPPLSVRYTMGRAIELARKASSAKFHLLDVGEKLLIGSAPMKLAVVKKCP